MEGCEKGESQGIGRLDWIARPQPLPILPNSLGLPAWAIALANKLARIAWEVLNKERNFECTRGGLRPFPGARRPESGAVSLWAGPWRLPGPTDRNRSARKRNRSLDAPAPKFRILKIHRAETGAEIRGLRCETSDIPRQRPGPSLTLGNVDTRPSPGNGRRETIVEFLPFLHWQDSTSKQSVK
jgi:hypothetical protein